MIFVLSTILGLIAGVMSAVVLRVVISRMGRPLWEFARPSELEQALFVLLETRLKSILGIHPLLERVWRPDLNCRVREGLEHFAPWGRVPTKTEIQKALWGTVARSLARLDQEALAAYGMLPLPRAAGLPNQAWATNRFWGEEPFHRMTIEGRDPADWEERRKLVHRRDGGRCVRCGVRVSLRYCHIHHLVPRGLGGDHGFQNLVTLCRSCHTFADGHESMRAIGLFVLSAGVIHTSGCWKHFGGRKISGSLPHLLHELQAVSCASCNPWGEYHKRRDVWRPWIALKLSESAQELVERAVSQLPTQAPSLPSWARWANTCPRAAGWVIGIAVSLVVHLVGNW